jgi:hypothetical protein
LLIDVVRQELDVAKLLCPLFNLWRCVCGEAGQCAVLSVQLLRFVPMRLHGPHQSA